MYSPAVSPRRERIFYGWWVVGAGFGLEALIGSLFFYAYGAYVVLLREEFGWSRTLLSAAFALARAESAVLGPIQGWLTDRFGPRVLIRTGMVILGVGFMLFSRINSPVTFFLTFFVMAVGAGLGGYLPITVAIVNWFRRRRAQALSLSSVGMAMGGLMTPLVAGLMLQVGWRWTAFLSGVVIIVAGLPLAQLMRHRPEAYGWRVDGDAADAAPAAAAAARLPADVDFTARQALRTRAFWLISAGHGSALLVVSAVMVHMVVHVTERLGISLAQAAGVVSLITISQIAGQLSGGWAGDRFSKRAIVVGCMVGHAAALLLLAYATTYWMVVVFAMLHGLAWGTRGPLMAAIRADYFGSGSFGMISGISSMVVMLGMIAGPLVAGILADRTGSYVMGFTVLAVLAALGSIFFLLARRPDAAGRSAPRAGPHRGRHRAHVVDAAAPGPAAGLLEHGPEARVVGEVGVGGQVRARRRATASTRAPSSGSYSRPSWPTRSMLPSSVLRSMTMRMRSPSRTLPTGPPASASGPTWPMQAPVETPEKRASVITATCLPQERCLSAAVIW